MTESAIPSLVDKASIIFQGTIRAASASTMREVKASDAVAIVRVDKVLRATRNLDHLTGSEVTLRWAGTTTPTSGSRAIFFTNPWIYGTRVAVVEVGHTESSKEPEVVVAIANHPTQHLTRRLIETELVVVGKVEKIEPSDIREPVSHHSPRWMRATIQVEAVEKGTLAAKTVGVLFASAQDIKWRWAPRLYPGQDGVFLLKRGQGPYAPPDAYTITDLRDVHARETVLRIRTLVK